MKIQRFSNGEVVFRITGRLQAENLPEIRALFETEAGRSVLLDLKDLTLVDGDSVRLLKRCEADGIEFKSCPAYIREWIERERNEG